MRVRFVGGPWHNRVRETGPELNPVWHIAVPPEEDPALLHPASTWTRESYHLHKFRTPHGTRYVQYIHESLIAKNGKPDPCAYKERFKKWSLGLKA